MGPFFFYTPPLDAVSTFFSTKRRVFPTVEKNPLRLPIIRGPFHKKCNPGEFWGPPCAKSGPLSKIEGFPLTPVENVNLPAYLRGNVKKKVLCRMQPQVPKTFLKISPGKLPLTLP